MKQKTLNQAGAMLVGGGKAMAEYVLAKALARKKGEGTSLMMVRYPPA